MLIIAFFSVVFSDLVVLFFCSDLFSLWICFMLNITGRISNAIQEVFADKLLAGKLQTLNAHACINNRGWKNDVSGKGWVQWLLTVYV